ncbi:MAG TPA: urea amidolyase associated protein UAAP2 [Polyangiales bacterium]|nr:urea amidolyase associated protein UAAP2 [Polyangiales bacterium]
MQALLKQSDRDPKDAVSDVVVGSGEPYVGTIAKGQTFRIVDLEGNQAVDTLFYCVDDLAERYSAADTIRMQRKLYLSTGTVLYSSLARPMLTIVADTCGRHDTLGGACAAESNTVRYGQHTKHMHSCRDNFLRAIAANEIALEKRDLASNINFFMNVPVTPTGKLTFEDGISAGGKYVEMRAETDVLVLISNCPQLNNPCNAYNPTPIRLLTWNG